MENSYNYSVPTLAAGAGGFEERVRAGYIPNPDGAHTPKSEESSTVETVTLPVNQQIPNFDKRHQTIYEITMEGGREYLTYSGIWRAEFLKGNEKLAKAYRTARIQSGESDFNESDNSIDSRIFTFNRDDSATKIAEYGLGLSTLRRNYDEAEEITPYFTGLNRVIDAEVSAKLLYETLDAFNDNLKFTQDMQYFDNRTENRVKYYFGYNTNDDAGLYRDKALNVRVSYNSFLVHRSKPLLGDLLQFAQTGEYVVGKYPDGTVQFVLKPALVERLIRKYNSEEALAMRYNDARIAVEKVYPDDYKGVDNIVDIKGATTHSINTIFGLTTSTEKK